jgi:pyrophosphate--fructose-6-phosphate 1-phosphotransferase
MQRWHMLAAFSARARLPRRMIVHEVMGRDCGWLTAATAASYRKALSKRMLLPQIGLTKTRLDVHAVFIPEVPVNFEQEAARLKKILDEHDNVNIFISEGAGVKDIVAQMEAEGKEVQRDAFGHVKLDTINPGKYFADTFSQLIGAEKVLVQKSGYFARSAAANTDDLELIRDSAVLAVEMACQRIGGVIGQDEDTPTNELRCIEFPRIKGGKPFDTEVPWFKQMQHEIGQATMDAYPMNEMKK